MPRAVLLGATGYTGRLTAEAMLRRGVRPLLAGRSRDSLDALAADLGGELDTALASVERPESIRALLEPGDALVTTVGPFMRLGGPAVTAAIEARAHYIDTTGEGAFVRSVFEQRDTAAREAGIAMLPALGLDYVPGNLAGALALTEAGDAATRIEIAYFFTGSTRGGLSRGTVASAAAIFARPIFTFTEGRLAPARPGAHVRTFDADRERRPALTLGSSEELWLPRLFPNVREARVFQGGLGAATRPGAMMGRLTGVPPLRKALAAASRRLAARSAHGPTAEQRASSGTLIVAEAFGDDDRQLARVELTGPNVYDLTAELVAWGAETVLAEDVGSGVMGPVEAFGLDRLAAEARELGLVNSAAPLAARGSR